MGVLTSGSVETGCCMCPCMAHADIYPPVYALAHALTYVCACVYTYTSTYNYAHTNIYGIFAEISDKTTEVNLFLSFYPF